MVPARALPLIQQPAGHWRLVDRILATYGLLVAAVAATRLEHQGVPAVLVAHLALPALIWLIVHAPASPLVRIVRGVYPVLLLIGLYGAIDVLNGFGAAATWDRPIQSIEQAIFGMQPSRDWWRASPNAFWSSVLHAAYLSYYIVVPAPLILFLVRHRSDLVERYLNGLLATYLVCYLCYLFVPVSGPYYQFARPGGAFVANLPAQMVYRVLGSGSAFGAAFPSSHVAAMVAAVIGAMRGSRRAALVLAVPTSLMTVAVVYCQMHYVLDSVAGLLVGSVVAGLVTRQQKGDST